MGNDNGKFDYEKRIADYRASTDQKALEWRAAVLEMGEREQKRTYFRFAVADDNPSYRTRANAAAAQLEFRTRIDGTSVISTVVPDTSRKWMLITSARIEKRKAGEHL